MQLQSNEQDLHFTGYSGNLFWCGGQVQNQLRKIQSGFYVPKTFQIGGSITELFQKYKVDVWNTLHIAIN